MSNKLTGRLVRNIKVGQEIIIGEEIKIIMIKHGGEGKNTAKFLIEAPKYLYIKLGDVPEKEGK